MTVESVVEKPAFRAIVRINRGQRLACFHRDPSLGIGQSGCLAIDWSKGNLPRVDCYEEIPDGDFWGLITAKSIGEAWLDWQERKTNVPLSRPGNLHVTFKKLGSYKLDPRTKALQLPSLDQRGVGVIRVVAALN